MRASELVTEFEKRFNSRHASSPVRRPLLTNELMVAYLFAKWLDRKYIIAERPHKEKRDVKTHKSRT